MEMNAHYKDFTDELASLIDTQDYFQPPPSSFHFAGPNSRQTPSPQQQHQQQQQQQPYHHALASRSRSRSRPPSVSESASAGSIGPARRSRRNNSVSSTSPPPYPRPHAIVIPATRPGNGSGWFTQSSASDFSLATPSSEMGPHQPHTPLSYTPFSIPDQPQKQNSIDFSLYHQGSPPPSAYPYSPSSSVPLTLANHHHHHHPAANGSVGNSLAGALSSSLPIQSSSIIHQPGSPGSTGTIVSPFGISTPYAVGGPTASPTTASAVPPHHSHPPSTTVPASALSPQDKQALIANEKRRRRRESHNAVERRRRDNINEKITELATLIPECMLEGGNVANNGGSVSPSTEGHSHFLDGADPLLPASMSLTKKDDIVKEEGDPTSSTPTGASAESGIVKANKGMILRKSVEYIRYLQQLVTAQGARNRELEQELKAYRSGGTSSSDSNSISSPASTAPSNSGLGACDSSSTATPNPSNPHGNMTSKRRQNSAQSSNNNSLKRRGQQTKGRSPSDQGDEFDEKDLPLLPDEHDREDHEHEHDESSDPEGDYEDDLGENGHFGGMLGGMAGMSGMVLADEGMRLEFPAQHGQATRPTPTAAARGRRTARGSTTTTANSTSLGSNVNVNQHHQPIHPSHHHHHQQHPHTMQNMNMNNMNLGMFPDGLGMSVPVSVHPTGMTTDLSMEMEVDPREQHDAQAAAASAAAAAAAAAAIERGRTSTRPGAGGAVTGGGPVVLAQKRSFVGNGRVNGHPNGSTVTLSTVGNPTNSNGVRLKEELVDVGVALGLGSTMGMGMGMLPMGMST